MTRKQAKKQLEELFLSSGEGEGLSIMGELYSDVSKNSWTFTVGNAECGGVAKWTCTWEPIPATTPTEREGRERLAAH